MDRLETVLTTFIRHMDEGLSTLREHVDRDIAEMREWRLESQKRWGEIAQKLGKFVEDIGICQSIW